MEVAKKEMPPKVSDLPTKSKRLKGTAPYVVEASLRYAAAVGSMLLVIAIIAVVVDVIGRLIKIPVYGVEELNTLLMVGCIFLGIAHAQTTKMHLTVSIFTDRLPKVVGECLNCLMLVVALAFVAVFGYQSTMQAYKSFVIREYVQGVVQFPVYPSRWLLAIGLILLGVQLIFDIGAGVKRILAAKGLV